LSILAGNLNGCPAISDYMGLGGNDIHHDEEDAKTIFFSELLYSVVYVFGMETMIAEREEKTRGRGAQDII